MTWLCIKHDESHFKRMSFGGNCPCKIRSMQTGFQDVMTQQILFNFCRECKPLAGSAAELEAFKKIQEGFANQFELFFPDNLAAKTIVVIPSLTLDQEVLAKVDLKYLRMFELLDLNE